MARRGVIAALVWFGIGARVTGLAGSRSHEVLGKGGRAEPKTTRGALGF